MLTITFKDLPVRETLHHPAAAFEGVYQDEWFDLDLVRQMIRDIDKTDVINCHTLMSPVLGQIPPEYLSTGVKGLIIMACEEGARDLYFLSSKYGQNCFKWMFTLSTIYGIKLVANSYFHVPVECLPTDQEYKVYFINQDYMTTDLNDVNDKLIMWG